MKPTEYKDAQREVWDLRFETPDIIDACRELGITLAQLQDPGRLDFGSLLSLGWYGVRQLGAAKGVTRAEFLGNKRTPPAKFGELVAATGAALGESMQVGDGSEGKTGPFESGTSET